MQELLDTLSDGIWWLGVYFLCRTAFSVYRWYFLVDRSGNSGTFGRHWSEETD